MSAILSSKMASVVKMKFQLLVLSSSLSWSMLTLHARSRAVYLHWHAVLYYIFLYVLRAYCVLPGATSIPLFIFHSSTATIIYGTRLEKQPLLCGENRIEVLKLVLGASKGRFLFIIKGAFGLISLCVIQYTAIDGEPKVRIHFF